MALPTSNVCSILMLLLLVFLTLATTHGWTTTPSPARHWNRFDRLRPGSIRSHSSSCRRCLSTETKAGVADKKSVQEELLVSRVGITESKTTRNSTPFLHSESDTNKVPSVGAATWTERVRQLLLFSQAHGHTRVPKRYRENPTLGNWVNKQRQHYRNYLQGIKPCSLTKDRINILNEIGFVWDASVKKHDNDEDSIQGEDDWWTQFRELERLLAKADKQHNTHTAISLASPTGKWLQRQRKNYQRQREGSDYTDLSSARGVGRPKHTWTLKTDQLHAMHNLDQDWWMSYRQWQWMRRYRELQDYIKEHGDCCVPISYHNKQLAHWVSNQRKQYNLRSQGKPSDMTKDRVEKLNAIGFVWDRWEYEFAKNQDKWVNGEGLLREV